MNLYWVSSLINAVIFVSVFSVMIGSYFTGVQVLISLSSAKEAPALFKRENSRGFHIGAWAAVGLNSILVVAVSFILSSKLFNYLIAACSYFAFYGWSINLIVFIRWLSRRGKDENYTSRLILGKAGAYSALILTLILAAVSLNVPDFRVGFYSSLFFIALICIFYMVSVKRKKQL